VQPRIAAQQYGDKHKFYKLVADSKIYVIILIYFYHHIVALRGKWRPAVLNFGPLWTGISVGSDAL